MKFTAASFEKAKKELSTKPQVKKLMEQHADFKFKPSHQRSPFESLIRSIAHQQLHGRAAETILQRMIDSFPGSSFPSPEDLIATPDAKLRSCGFSQSKIRSLKDIAEKTLSGLVPSSKEINKLSNEEIVSRLTQIYGVGRWTVEMLLIFQLGRLDVWPVDDYGIRKGFQIWQKKKEMPTAKDLKAVGHKWAPYQTVLSLFLWQEANLFNQRKTEQKLIAKASRTSANLRPKKTNNKRKGDTK